MSHQLVKAPSQQLFRLQATMVTLNSRIAGSLPGSAEWNAPREFRNRKLGITCQNDINTLALVSYTHRVLNLVNEPCWCRFSQQWFGIILAYAKRSLPFKVKFDSMLIKMSAAIAALDYTNWGSVSHYINKLLYFPLSSESRQEWGSSVLNCRPTLTMATVALVTAGKLKAGSSCRGAGIRFFIKRRGADTCTNIVRDVAMTTANLPPVQWRQQNLMLSLARWLSIRSAAVNKTACYF